MANFKFTKNSSKSNSNLKNAASTLPAGTNAQTLFNSNQKKFNDLNNNETTAAHDSNQRSVEPEFIDVKIVFPNGKTYEQAIDAKKAIYDLLIELSAAARLIPTNYTLKLYSDQDDKKEIDNLIEYTPNQRIGQLSPAKIRIVPKTATLKHQQFNLFNTEEPKKPDLLPVASVNKSSMTLPATNDSNNKFNKTSSLGSNWIITKTSNQPTQALQGTSQGSNVPQKPFELTVCVQVNLPFNQKTIVRVKREILLEDLFSLICREQNLEKDKYEFYIPNLQEAYTMQESFANFDTKEVCLVLKKHLKQFTSASDTSRYQSQQFTVFTQNSSKSRANNPRAYTNQANRYAKQEILQRSKSDIDLSFSAHISEEDNNSSSGNDNNSSFNSNGDSRATSGSKMMKRLFGKKLDSDKKSLSKSRGSLNTSECSDMKLPMNLNDSKLSLNSSKSGELRNLKKKAPAPPPPVSESLHQAVLQNMLNKKKTKAPAPPPPQPQPTAVPTLNVETKTAVSDINEPGQSVSSVSSPSSDPSSSLSSPLSSMSSQASSSHSKASDGMTACTIGSLIIPAAELAAASTVSSTETTTTKVTILNICQASSSPLSERNFKKVDASEISDEQMSSIACKRTDSIRSIGSDIDGSLNNMEQSIVSNGSHNRTDELEVGKVEQTTIYQHEDNNNDDNSCYLSSQTLNCVKSGTGVLHQHQQNRTYSEEDDFNSSDLETINSPIPYNKPITAKQSEKQPFTSVADSIAAGLTNNLYDYDLMRHRPSNQSTTIFSCINSVNDSVDEYPVVSPSISKPNQSLASPRLKMSVIEEIQQPEFSTCSTIQIQDNDIDQELSRINGAKSPSGNGVANNKSSTLPAEAKPSFTMNLRSPTSPPPQFPAIPEKDLNEQHANFTVVRSGEIVEKNGTYYSTDGTVRGYSGTVKKIANSKSLKEIFEKHKELEQQHEIEYEQELKQKMERDQREQDRAQVRIQEEQAKRQQQLMQTKPNKLEVQEVTKQPNVNFKSTLSSIIANEKRSSLPANSSLRPNFFTPKPFVKQQMNVTQTSSVSAPASAVDNELQKKLENRRQSILAAQKKQEEKLQQKALQKKLADQVVVNVPMPHIYENTANLQIDIKSFNSLSSESTSNSTMSSSSSASSSKHNSQVSPIMHFVPPAPPIGGFNDNTNKAMSDSSSSSSLSISSTDSSTTNNQKLKTTSRPKQRPQENHVDRVGMLLDELKSVVPRVEEGSNLIIERTPKPASKVGPSTAPKNFNSQILKAINQKNQIVDSRDSLLDSIKSFSFNSLRRTGN